MFAKNNTLFRRVFIMMVSSFLFLTVMEQKVVAQSREPAKKKKLGKKSKKKSDKLDISDLEKKYWAPKDVDYSVVQNRTYSKKGRFSFSIQMGPIINDTFSDGGSLGLTANYYFTEKIGAELNYVSSDLSDSDVTTSFVDNVGGNGGVAPDFGRVKSYSGAGLSWIPFYAKMSVLGKRIIYFDMSITPGFGITEYEQVTDPSMPNKTKTAVTYSIDIAQHFFLTNHFVIRADLKNRWHNEDVVKYSNGAELRSISTNTTIFLIGLTYFF